MKPQSQGIKSPWVNKLHRTWSFNEISARYTELPDEFYVPEDDRVREQNTTNKQGSGDRLALLSMDRALDAITAAQRETNEKYKYLLRLGVSRELARIVLPVSIYTEMYATVDLHNLFHFLGLRLDEHAQYEIRVYAQAILDLIRPLVPVAVSAWEKVQQ